MDSEHAVGYAAMMCISLIHVPQLVHTYRLRSAQEVSWGMLVLNAMVSGLSTCYGFMIDKPPLYVANAISGVNVALLAWMKHRYAARRAAPASGSVVPVRPDFINKPA